MNIKNVIIDEYGSAEDLDFFIPEIQKLDNLKLEGVQTQLTKDSPFFFEEVAASKIPTANGWWKWVTIHKSGMAIGFVALVVAVISVIQLTK